MYRKIAKTLAGGMLASMLAVGAAQAQQSNSGPKQINVGCLYAESGLVSTQSMKLHKGLLFWRDMVNSDGGVYVKAYKKKVPINLECLNDQSSPTLVGPLTQQLIDKHVDLLVADSSSYLAAASVPIARNNKMLLINPTGTSAKFYTADNPYNVATSVLVTRFWAANIANLLVKNKINKVAILYGTNDFDAPQAAAMKKTLEENHISVVYYRDMPTTTSNYIILLNTIKAAEPNALIHLGYEANDVAFLKDLRTSKMHFNLVYTVYPTLVPDSFSGPDRQAELMYKLVPMIAPGLNVTDVNFGLTTKQFKEQFKKHFNYDAEYFEAAGYVAGLAMQKALSESPSLDQLDLRKALAEASGKMITVIGPFTITSTGAQTGAVFGVGQFQPDGKGGMRLVGLSPEKYADGKLIYPAPSASN